MTRQDDALLVIDALRPTGADGVYNPKPSESEYRQRVAQVVEWFHQHHRPVFYCNDAHLRGSDRLCQKSRLRALVRC